YQWRSNSVAISGATSSTLTLNNVQSGQAGSYQVVVANSFGSVTSAVATLTVLGNVTTNGLALWLRADVGPVLNGSAVTQWTDQSGNNRNATQATGANQPTRQAS